MRKKFIAALLCVAMVLTLLAGCGSSSSSTASGSVAGTYEGTGKGRNGDIVVAVTLDDNAVITNIEVKEQQETEGVGDIAFDPMIYQMVEHNSVAVDAIATATLTSNGLLEAVRNALTAAGVNPDDYNGEVSTAKGEDTPMTWTWPLWAQAVPAWLPPLLPLRTAQASWCWRRLLPSAATPSWARAPTMWPTPSVRSS